MDVPATQARYIRFVITDTYPTYDGLRVSLGEVYAWVQQLLKSITLHPFLSIGLN